MRLLALTAAAICLVAPSAFAADVDGDLIDDAVYNCLGVDNPNQIDADTTALAIAAMQISITTARSTWLILV